MRCSVIAVFVFSLESPGEEDDQLQFDILPAIKEKENRNILMICFFLMKISLIWESEIPNCIKCSASLELVPIFSVGTPYRATGGGRDPVVLLSLAPLRLRGLRPLRPRPRLRQLLAAGSPVAPQPPLYSGALQPKWTPGTSSQKIKKMKINSWYFLKEKSCRSWWVANIAATSD
jgi:hypothetical protein